MTQFLYLVNHFFVAATQRLPLGHLALEAQGTCISRSHGTTAVSKIVLGKISLPGHCTDNRLKHTSGHTKNRPIFLSRTFDLRGRLWLDKFSLLYRYSQKWRLGNAIFVISLCIPTACWCLPERSLYSCWYHDYCGCCQRTSLHYLALVASRDYTLRC